jgi:hypothetical protein
MPRPILHMLLKPAIFGLTTACAAVPLPAQPVPVVAPVTATTSDSLAGVADIADLALASPVIVRATIVKAQPLSRRFAPDVAAGRIRLVITAAVSNVLVAPGTMTGTLQWLWDAPTDARGRAPRAKGLDVLAFLTTPAAGGATRLVSRRAQQAYDPALADQVRSLVQADRAGGVPVARGVTNGFRAVGTIPGESESQFFLATADGKPATLVVQNRPGEQRRVLMARGDIIDESAQPVVPGSLLWYRLACFLPPRLPAAAGGNDRALARDWQDALASLGPCGRTG